MYSYNKFDIIVVPKADNMLFFNLQNILKDAENSPRIILQLLNNHYERKIPKYLGRSFLKNPQEFLSSKQDILFKIQYLNLAACRDYHTYRLYSILTLDLSYYPELDKASVKLNPLLEIVNNKILFLYEEEQKKELKWQR